MQKMPSMECGDYSTIIAEHTCLAKDLCLATSGRWSDFFDLIDSNPQKAKEERGWLSFLYERRLREECNSSIEDFYFFLYQYLTAENNYILTTFIQKRTHFFSGYFQDILKGAYKEYASTVTDRLDSTSMDDDEEGNKHESIPDSRSMRKDEVPPPKFHPLYVWQKNQKDFLTIFLRFVLLQGNAYTAALLGYPSDNAVSARVAHLKNKKTSAFSADGKNEATALDSWLRHNLHLSFSFPFHNKRNGIFIFFSLPFDCSAPDETYLRLECFYANDRPLPGAVLQWGNLRCEIKNGMGALLLREFHSDIEKHTKGDISLLLSDGTRLDGMPRIGNYAPVKQLSDEQILRLRDMNDDLDCLSEFLHDFGTGLTFLLNNRLNFARFGGSRHLEYSLLIPTEGEAWAIFANSEPDSSGSIPVNGFVFPLEWRLHPELERPHSRQLPPAVIRLGGKIAAQLNAKGWGLYPAFRFFHDRVDFSQLSVIGGSDESISSAYLTLLAALTHAINGRYKTPVPVFASAQMDFPDGELRAIGHLKQKLEIAKEWGAAFFFVSAEQYDEAEKLAAANHLSMKIVPVATEQPERMGRFSAYYFLHDLHSDDNELKCVAEDKFKVKRSELVMEISAKANLQWDNRDSQKKEFGSLSVLVGRPGMGKSILMRDLAERWQNHKVFCHVCRAGEKYPVQSFIRNLSRQLAMYSELFAGRILAELKKGAIPDVADEHELCALYERFVISPLCAIQIAGAAKRHYLLIDGLDEDDSGMIARLLGKRQYRYPKNFSIVVSTRPVEPIFSEIESAATSIINLAANKFDEVCGKDLEKFIINLIYSNETIRQCWENSSAFLDDDELRAKISRKDKSFLFATYVLLGIAEGQYHFDRLDQELPSGLTAFYNDSFHYRFPTEKAYEKVRPLLTVLSRESKLKVQTAAEILKHNNCQEPIGKMIQALRGYCIADGDELSLSDATLREWLLDPIRNPEFSIL